MQGMGASEGCPTTGGREDVLSATAAVDRLNGGTDANGARWPSTGAPAPWA
ncbi:hypothetical protein ABZ815_24625 [Nonomuraea sp. NPDC047529]|uniref:hypothetical protein n=1 Tax=Nonomuraea sp. NPDC047529 TaxID=3155623 RepID=UPI0033D58350